MEEEYENEMKEFQLIWNELRRKALDRDSGKLHLGGLYPAKGEGQG